MTDNFPATRDGADVIAREQVWIREARKAGEAQTGTGATTGPQTAAQTAAETKAQFRCSGLALSGGGIRSATFALGLVQALAAKGLLERFDYLSTVSGGGYTGAALTWLRKNGGSLGEKFRYGTGDPADAAEQYAPNSRLKRLRERGNYLTPGKGVTFLSLVAIVLRGTLLNWLVWFPLGTLLLLVLAHLSYWVVILTVASDAASWSWLPWDDAYGNLRAAAGAIGERVPRFAPIEFLGAVLLALFIVVCAVYSLSTFSHRNPDGFLKGIRDRIKRYQWRRRFEKGTPHLLSVGLACLVVASLPWVYLSLSETGSNSAGFAASFIGLLSAGFTYLRKGKESGFVPTSVLATFGGIFLVYGFALLAFGYLVSFKTAAVPAALFWGLVAVAAITGYFVNLNYISLHRFYRDRLMEAFMPDPKGDDGKVPELALRADTTRLSSVCGRRDDRTSGVDDPLLPLHLVNANLVLTGSHSRRRAFRGGDSFVLSPLYSGSWATGWIDTKDFMSDGMTLSTAMAISGAAAHPHTGVGGTGLTRNRVVSFLMAAMNIRLGYWIPNPGHMTKKPFFAYQVMRSVNHFAAFLYEVGILKLDEDARRMQLSDGGHFENLGIYELVRRRVDLIVVSDCGADAEFAFEDLQTSVRRCAQDFGAKITFNCGRGELSDLIPSRDPLREVRFPQGVQVAEAPGFVVGCIQYPADETGKLPASVGTLVYIKSTLVDGLSVETLGYKGSHPEFPDESTVDQFFDDKQFEAYRELGYRIGMAASEEVAREFEALQAGT